MIFPEKMKKINMHILKDDVDMVLKFLSDSECIQLVFKDKKSMETAGFSEIEFSDYKIKLERLISFTELDVDKENIKYKKEKLNTLKMDEEDFLSYPPKSAERGFSHI